MSEKEIRGLLARACDELDRVARKARKLALPTALGASLALSACGGTQKSEGTPDPIDNGDKVETAADAGVAEPPPTPVADAAVRRVPDDRPPDWDIPKPYMAPDAAPLYQTIEKQA